MIVIIFCNAMALNNQEPLLIGFVGGGLTNNKPPGRTVNSHRAHRFAPSPDYPEINCQKMPAPL